MTADQIVKRATVSGAYVVQVNAGTRWEPWYAPGLGLVEWDSQEEAEAAARHEKYGVAVTHPGQAWRVVEVHPDDVKLDATPNNIDILATPDNIDILATPDNINILARVDALETLARQSERASIAYNACHTKTMRQLRDKRVIRYGMARSAFAEWLEKLLKEATQI